MTRKLFVLVPLAALLAAFPVPVFAATSGTISATVTVAAPCITVGPSISYGTLLFAPAGTTPSPTSGSSSYTNCSSAAEQVGATGSDATSTTAGSTAVWTLQDMQPCITTTALNAYRVEAKDYQQVSVVLLSSTTALLDPALAPAMQQTLDTYLYMPCSGSSGAGETMQFTVTATAFF